MKHLMEKLEVLIKKQKKQKINLKDDTDDTNKYVRGGKNTLVIKIMHDLNDNPNLLNQQLTKIIIYFRVKRRKCLKKKKKKKI